ncbi:glucosaminidase domain-containing protein, partial [Bacillus cereus group sp. N21]|uniref:glucosaminidase domain-containing protein n=1 Tax=Bacillus cereus group sp. N21 TaxID=2794591 RepID=UPI0018F734D2
MKKLLIGVFLVPIMLLMVIGFFFFSLLEKEKSPGGGDSGIPPIGGLVCRNGAAKAEELKPHLRNAFAGHEQDFINAANKNGIDAILLVSIAQHETGYGNSNAVKNYNNPGGVMDWENAMKTIRRFGTLGEGIDFMARNLYKNYISQGLTTIQQIGPKYAPVGASN